MKYLICILLISCSNAPPSPKFKPGDQILHALYVSKFDEVNCQEKYIEVVEFKQNRYLTRYYNYYGELDVTSQEMFIKVNCPKR